MVREVTGREKSTFDKLAAHPLQSWAWGEFREKTGTEVLRLGRYEKNKLVETAQITFHKIPHLPWRIGYWPKGYWPTSQMLEAVKRESKLRKVIMVKLEPNVLMAERKDQIERYKRSFGLVSGRPLFTKWSFWLDLTKKEDELLGEMKQKTRYNVRLAERKGVKIIEDNSQEAFESYWRLTEETTKRQGFYAHTKRYHQLMFDTLVNAGLAHLFKAEYQGRVLVTWIIFILNGVIYYPYGASTREDREVFASNMMMWEIIKFGKREDCQLFDMWGSPGPKPKPSDPWVGFHRFKEGFGAKLVEFVGTFDQVINPLLYWPYRWGEEVRWLFLKAKAKLFR